jgi:hypothetical protein
MKTKILTIAFTAFLASCASFPGQEPSWQGHAISATYSIVTFDHNKTEARLQGEISRQHFQDWFKTDYPVAGERVEIPAEAKVFGALILMDGGDLLVMPLYSWGNGQNSLFKCQSPKIGQAPKFVVFERTQEDFMKSIKKRLEDLK